MEISDFPRQEDIPQVAELNTPWSMDAPPGQALYNEILY
jgi:hypothetical protein